MDLTVTGCAEKSVRRNTGLSITEEEEGGARGGERQRDAGRSTIRVL